MRILISSCFSAALVVVLLLCGSVAYADDIAPPVPSITESEDGSHVFVFNPHEDDNYPVMGVYRNTEPLEFVYQISSSERSIHIFSTDMRYFVSIQPVSTTTSVPVSYATAIDFHDNGALIKYYIISDFVRNMNMIRYSTTQAHWIDFGSDSIVFISTENSLTIKTVDNLTYVFDITSGDITSGPKQGVYLILVVCIAALCTSGLVVLVIYKRKKRKIQA